MAYGLTLSANDAGAQGTVQEGERTIYTRHLCIYIYSRCTTERSAPRGREPSAGEAGASQNTNLKNAEVANPRPYIFTSVVTQRQQMHRQKKVAKVWPHRPPPPTSKSSNRKIPNQEVCRVPSQNEGRPLGAHRLYIYIYIYILYSLLELVVTESPEGIPPPASQTTVASTRALEPDTRKNVSVVQTIYKSTGTPGKFFLELRLEYPPGLNFEYPICEFNTS